MKKLLYFPALVLAFQGWSCGVVQTVAVNSTSGILTYGMAALFEEPDLTIAESAIPGNLKLVEALYRAKDSDDDALGTMLAQGYTGYALAFVEDTDPERAKALYTRARDYGLKVLRKNKHFDAAFDQDAQTFQDAVKTFTKDDVPVIFWTANAWGSLVNLGMADPEIIGDLSKVNALMEFVEKTDEEFYYGSAHLYFGTIYATMPRVLGGKPDLAKQHFERCFAIGKNKMLLPFVYMAKSYAVQVQDKELFLSLLKQVEDAPIDILPEQRLVNAVAKRKAKALAARVDELF
ncbi:MAG TPA: TRAP transporter TatT component family protein [Bacteroidota bacterium]|nr:TRAP transporter TatT component family protein [Bacteroidota bacterium]